MNIPPIRYAKSGDSFLAYRVIGDGPTDLVLGGGLWSNIELEWEIPNVLQSMERLASFARVIAFDRRGTGLSTRSGSAESFDQRADDLRAVMDTVGSERAAVVGFSSGGPFSIVFAASHPERTSALILISGFARVNPAWDGIARYTSFEQARLAIESGWGSPFTINEIAPTLAKSERGREAFARFLRLAMSPDAAIAQMKTIFEMDVREVLPSIQVPTLVLHRGGDRSSRVEHGRELADGIPGARYVELPGDDTVWWVGDSGGIVDEIEEFLTGVRPQPRIDRVLATIMFTDLVGSTERAAELGDRRWRELLAAHHRDTGRAIAQFRGKEIKTTGDGVLATFDGPARAVQCAAAIGETAARHDLQVRAGLHTGEVELMGDDVGGIAVHIAARVAGLAGRGEVLVSSTVKDLVAGSGIRFLERGTHALKGVPDEWRLFAVEA